MLGGYQTTLASMFPSLKGITPDEQTLIMFLDVLMKNRIQTMLRRSRGKDANAACGQLRLRNLKGGSVAVQG